MASQEIRKQQPAMSISSSLDALFLGHEANKATPVHPRTHQWKDMMAIKEKYSAEDLALLSQTRGSTQKL
ncbi:unnamed protein product [Dovyalis caffra]|uniref:Uncharacterized protein n=1 Tax=Dovyalis caffra TaxID=77055 RepID=A0AAV1QYP1_9ROSI|nr:unnamed protein product [Dovyalis caffra]